VGGERGKDKRIRESRRLDVWSGQKKGVHEKKQQSRGENKRSTKGTKEKRKRRGEKGYSKAWRYLGGTTG